MTAPLRDRENTETFPQDDPATPRELVNDPPIGFQLGLGPVSEEESFAEVSFPPTESLLPTAGLNFGSGSDSFSMHRIQKREPSFLRKILPPVLGGLAAFPIATAILWYGLGKDIGSTGQFVGKYVPWIVPSKLRGGSFHSDGKFGGGRGSVSKSQPNTPSREAVAPEPKPIQEQKPGPSIRTTLQQIAELQRDWNNTPKNREKQLEKLSSFYSACVQLASQTGELRGNALRAWQKDLDQFSTSILSSPTFTKAIDLCSQGEIPSIPAPSLDGSVILIETLTIDKEVAGNQEFPSKLIADNRPLPLVIPESLIKQLKNPSEPRQRILLGRIVDSESNSVILVHCCLE